MSSKTMRILLNIYLSAITSHAVYFQIEMAPGFLKLKEEGRKEGS